MNRNLEFKIQVAGLVLAHWKDWKREDQEYILEQANRNKVRYVASEYEPNTITFKGDAGNLFEFMYDLAYRYDIEIV